MMIGQLSLMRVVQKLSVKSGVSKATQVQVGVMIVVWQIILVMYLMAVTLVHSSLMNLITVTTILIQLGGPLTWGESKPLNLK